MQKKRQNYFVYAILQLSRSRMIERHIFSDKNKNKWHSVWMIFIRIAAGNSRRL
jgi:hypothetical protein